MVTKPPMTDAKSMALPFLMASITTAMLSAIFLMATPKVSIAAAVPHRLAVFRAFSFRVSTAFPSVVAAGCKALAATASIRIPASVKDATS